MFLSHKNSGTSIDKETKEEEKNRQHQFDTSFPQIKIQNEDPVIFIAMSNQEEEHFTVLTSNMDALKHYVHSADHRIVILQLLRPDHKSNNRWAIYDIVRIEQYGATSSDGQYQSKCKFITSKGIAFGYNVSNIDTEFYAPQVKDEQAVFIEFNHA